MSDKFIDLVSMEMGGQVVEVTDESLSPGIGLIKREAPKETNGVRMSRQAYDGWETRRNNPRVEQSEFITFSFVFPGTIQGFNLDTRGIRVSDLPREVKLEAMVLGQERWVTLMEPTKLNPNGENFFMSEEFVSTIYDHVRLTIFRDGGISRLRIYGTVKRPPVTNLSQRTS
ncbi:hypothetical protein DSO57_1020208 [Entomophthora muscae]|uniref:Uncharacterized protein n=1 Tax=Entomophthora muscae TaxID=34485 RepID=A0ACC2T3V2_9FUNG|nr:hypothetical protein DSO57_1020208 [Entomophthora muscae]